MHHCPDCQTVVSASRIQSGVAQCPRCDHVFEVPDAPDAGATRTPQASERPKLQLPIPPTSVVVNPHSHGVEIRIPWKHLVSGWVHLVLFFIVLATLFAAVARDEGPFLLLLVPVVLYGWLTMVLNSTTILVAKRGIEISHGPIPTWHGTVQKSASSLRGLRVERERKVSYSRHGGRREYFVYHLDANGGRLLKHWPDALAPEYVKECIEAVVRHP